MIRSNNGFKDRSVGRVDMRVVVVMPARNEELLISNSVQNIPESVDWVVVVDDGSKDNTKHRAENALGSRGEVVSTKGLGVGGAIRVGCQHTLTRFGKDCVVVVMAGDGQMDPSDFSRVISPIINRTADHVKGNRWLHPDGPKGMPTIRKIGTWLLSRLTSLASGISIGDSQCGYTATSGRMLSLWDWEKNWEGYGYPNWWLMQAGQKGFRVSEVPVRSIYGSEISGISIPKFFFSVSLMLWIGIWKRGIDWYILSRETNPFVKLIATTLWFIGWSSFALAIYQPWALIAPPIIFPSLAMLDNKESKRRRRQHEAWQ